MSCHGASCSCSCTIVSRSVASADMPAFCSLCVSDEYTTEGVTDDGRRFIVCANTREHGPNGYVWEPVPEKPARLRGDGLGADLDIWDKLLECVPPDGIAHSYGDIEDIFFERYPDDAGVLQDRYGHAWREGKRSGQYSMSSYLSGRLGELAKEGSLEVAWGPAEGPWAYNGRISHWTRGRCWLTKEVVIVRGRWAYPEVLSLDSHESLDRSIPRSSFPKPTPTIFFCSDSLID